MTTVHIEQLTLYPVKSLRGIQVNDWPVTEEGLQFDRHWMLVMPNGRFITQRQLPRMSLIDTAIDGDHLVLSAASKGEVKLPLQYTQTLNSQPVFSATVWRDECDVVEAAAAASAWLNQALRPPQPLRLVAMAHDHQRVQSQPERFGANTHTRFADAAPFLVANNASLAALNHALTGKGMQPVDMRRFRPNIVLSGLEAFTEHQVSQLQRDDGLCLQLRDHCERCIMTTIDPDSGEKSADMEPYHTLASLNAMPDNPKAAAFAVNATLEIEAPSPPGIRRLSIGDSFSC
ncbi:MOSC domain-containing protein [Aestuariicella hydrocarbonica]|uniref:MOSC domain-containing protein n=1 Tax=Pseudomaricurvus hydrocarbonicus TaxID=1470433 RepID=A0A9E5JY52_9GAMM|nr:MOSC N-terminal beta barrel domain-containing protein [Aestuariicella hydrocarbonica]NHO64232.1 MOSC domain-containing protein [Aestuariicella hydrocarbonica]